MGLLGLVAWFLLPAAAPAQTAHLPPPHPGPQGQGAALQPPDYPLLPADEDYQYLRDPANRRDALDTIKFIPLNNRKTNYLSLGGEAREKVEDYRHFPLMAPPTHAYFLQRYMLHADLHLGAKWRFFGQIQSDHQGDYNGGMVQPQGPQVDRFDLNQGFAEYDTPLGGGNALTLRGGRQEINYGDGRLLSPRESPNVRQSFDGVRLSARVGTLRVDGLALRAVNIYPGSFDNRTLAGQDVWGIYATLPTEKVQARVPAGGPGSGIDVYALEYDRRGAVFSQGTAGEHRATVGIRLFGQTGNFDYDWEAAGQNGRFGGEGVRAYLAATDTGYTFRRLPLTPRLGLRADIASGGKDPHGHTLQTFNALYGRGDFYGEVNLFDSANLRDLRPSVDLYAGRTIITLDSFFLWRDSVQDGLYSPGMTLAFPASGSRSRYVGTLRAAQVLWQINRHFALTLNYTHLSAGRYLHEAGGQDVNYTMGLVDFKF